MGDPDTGRCSLLPYHTGLGTFQRWSRNIKKPDIQVGFLIYLWEMITSFLAFRLPFHLAFHHLYPLQEGRSMHIR